MKLLNPPAVDEVEILRQRVTSLEEELGDLEHLRNGLRPLYEALRPLFERRTSGAAHSEVWEAWKRKLGGKGAEMIEVLLQRGELTWVQIATLTGQSHTSGSFANRKSELNRNGLIEKNGEGIRLRKL